MVEEHTTLDENETECPTCGRDDFSSKNSMRSHHKQKHGESLAVVKKTCDYCGADFERRDSLIDESHDHAFCTQECFRNHYSDNKHFNEDGGRVTVECDYCGAETERWRNELDDHERLYCSKECCDKHKSEYQAGEDHHQYSRVEMPCANCGETVYKIPAVVEKNDHVFCDRACQAEWTSENLAGENSPIWTPRIKTNCANCGAVMERLPYEIEKKGNLFCDNECSAEWKSQNLAGEDHPLWKERVDTPCAYCGEVVSRTPGKANESGRAFCDHDCYGRWISDNLRGENSPKWEGGSHHYGPSWTEELKREIRERDGNKCRYCGISNKDHKDAYGFALHVHHIRPVRDFENKNEAHSKSNLITLCVRCHGIWEKIPYLKPT